MDCRASHGDLSLYDFAKHHYETVEPQQLRPTPLLTGDDLIALGHRPGPEFRRVLAAVEDAQLEGSLHTREDALALVESIFPRT